MLETMKEFFENRIQDYDRHMLCDITGSWAFYPFTAYHLPKTENCRVLDLGCGTGLELEYFFRANATAKVTGIDLSEKMLAELRRKFPDKQIELTVGSYFEVPLGENEFDAAVSVESLHHFTKEEKISLYVRLNRALKADGYFVLTDFFASTDEEERVCRAEFEELKKSQGLKGGELYHFDTPLTVKHEAEALYAAGFTKVEVLDSWGQTCTLKAIK